MKTLQQLQATSRKEIALFQDFLALIAHTGRPFRILSSTRIINSSSSEVEMMARTAYTVANVPLLDNNENIGANSSPTHMVNDSVLRFDRQSLLMTGK